MDFMSKPGFPPPILDVKKPLNGSETGFVTGIWLIYRGGKGIGKAVECSLKENSALAVANTKDSILLDRRRSNLRLSYKFFEPDVQKNLEKFIRRSVKRIINNISAAMTRGVSPWRALAH